jgi:hypothetical protein
VTREDAIAAIAGETPLTAADLEGFLACSDIERSELVAAYLDAGKMASASAWDVVIAILKECAELANVVVPLEGAVQGIFGIVAATK